MERAARRLQPIATHLAAASEPLATVETDVLVRATRPAIRGQQEPSPVAWGEREWGALAAEQAAEGILDRGMVGEVDRAAFLRDGVLVLPGVMSNPAALAEALRQAQEWNDAVVKHAPSWPEVIDWAGLGAEGPPPQPLTPEEIETAVGNSQKVPGASQQPSEIGLATGAHYLRRHSVLSEYFPPGHHKTIMNWLTHPQMLSLQRQLLGTTADRLYFDHAQLLTRTRYPGGQWHSHRCQEQAGESPYDDCGPCASLEEYDAQPNTILNLICKSSSFSFSSFSPSQVEQVSLTRKHITIRPRRFQR